MGSISSTEYKDIMKVLMDIKGDIGGIKEHLKNINGSVARHEGAIEKHKEDMENLVSDTNEKITKIKVTLGKWAGGMAVCLIILQGILYNAGSVV